MTLGISSSGRRLRQMRDMISTPVAWWQPRGRRDISECDPPLSVSVTTYSPCQRNTSPHCREAIMLTVKRHASTILGAFEQARTELIGKAVILTDGKAGT